MKVWEQLSFWTNDELIGTVASEILALARKHGEPQPPQGMPVEKAIPFTYPQMSDDEPHIEQMLRRVAIVLQAVDQHAFWHKRVMVSTKPFDPIPDWAKDMKEMAVNPQWTLFVSEATEIINQFVDSLANRGICWKH